MPLTAVSAYVQEIGAVSPIFSLQPAKPMNPASTMKLLTTFAGLDLLGPNFRWKTEVYADGRNGGDLGGSAAQSVILMIIVIGLTAIQFRYIERKVTY